MRRHKLTTAIHMLVGTTQTSINATVSYLVTEHDEGMQPEITVISVRAPDGQAAPWLEQAIMADVSTRDLMVDHARSEAVPELRAA